MEGGNRRRWPSWRNLKRQLGFKQINIFSFCGSSKWDDLDTNAAGEQPLIISGDQSPAAWETMVSGGQMSRILAGDDEVTVNLATALAAERRQLNVTVKPLKSLVQLFEEIDGREVVNVKVVHDGGDDVRGGGGIGTVCCLCTERSKGAALIPCGHTYCRACCRAMWRKRETCPLCNRSIMDVLEIL